jgi:excisionase family DNA binding protein
MHDLEKDRRRTISVDEAARKLGISRGAAYEAVHAGQIPVIKIGRRLLVPTIAFELMLAGEAQPKAAAS